MVEKEVDIAWIKVSNRFRTDFGDIKSLADSIKQQGLIHAITVTADGDLLAGQRRLEACVSLGWTTIPARIVETLGDAATALRIERDENTCRKPMNPQELVGLGRALEEVVKVQARQRQSEAGAMAAKVRNRGRALAPGRESITGEAIHTDVVVGSVLGWGKDSYRRAKAVVDMAANPSLGPKDHERAVQALEEMNRTGQVRPSYLRINDLYLAETKRVKESEPVDVSAAMIREQRQVLDGLSSMLSGVPRALDTLKDLSPLALDDPNQVQLWMRDLTEARRTITIIINKMRENTRES